MSELINVDAGITDASKMTTLLEGKGGRRDSDVADSVPLSAAPLTETGTFQKSQGGRRDTDIGSDGPLASAPQPDSLTWASDSAPASAPISFMLQFAEPVVLDTSTDRAATATHTRNDGAGGGGDTDLEMMASSTATDARGNGAKRDSDVGAEGFTAMSTASNRPWTH